MIYAFTLVLFVSYLLVISRSVLVGKYLYKLNMAVEKKLAGLREQSLELEGTKVSYYTAGSRDNPSMLLLHGFSANKAIWHRFAKRAAKDYYLIIPDLLGHGETPYKSSQSYSTKQQSAMLQSLLAQLEIDECAVIGNSMGGMIAMQLLQAEDARISKAVLLDPAGVKSDFAQGMANSGHNPFEHASIQDFFSFYERAMAKPPFVPPAALHFIGQNDYLQRRDALSHMFRDFFNLEDFFEAPIMGFEDRLKIIWGEKDGLLPLKDAEIWQRLTGIKADVYPDIGHMPMVECTAVSYADCKAFLEQA